MTRTLTIGLCTFVVSCTPEPRVVPTPPRPKYVLLMSGAHQCAPSARARPAFDTFCASHRHVVECRFDIEYMGMRHPFDSTPTFALLTPDSLLIDYSKGAAKGWVESKLTALLRRNRLIEAPTTYRNAHASPKLGVPRELLSGAVGLSNLDLTGEDLSDLDLTGSSFDGSDLRGVDFTNTTLDEANMSHADLRGANLTGVSAKNTYWNSTICPDGTRSDTKPHVSCVP